MKWEWIGKVGRMGKGRYYINVPESVGEKVHKKSIKVMVEEI
jgi:hypothetical protein